MSSAVLPQALLSIPKTPTQCTLPQTKLAFSAVVAPRLSSLAFFSRCSPSCVSSGPPKWGKNRSVVVWAEANAEAEAEAEVEESTENDEAVESEEAEIESEEIESEEKTPRPPRIKLGDIMGILNKKAIEASDKERPTPDLRTGDIVEIKLEVPENRRRLSVYKGIVISKQNAGIHTTIRIRRIIAGVGVEIVFPIFTKHQRD
ncbi:50S ribosomal L19-2, chloroplastic-like [Olea europaea subsp. europaea]|uniref:50S ribosomal L19-2, chloroplastic-like n=1 Tax=Olea europaea subsp. europaea TaxID=158383 RepID=A0A8S0RFJ9_OLEEU|nr:50S ribosomal L19-2, chloroplastic-like [Olea europaea subsp. europaea]